jgi:hypothetical protein
VTSQQRLVWLITVALAITGTQLAHWVAYRAVEPSAADRAHDLDVASHAYLAHLPLALAVCAVVVVSALAARIRHVAAMSAGTALESRVGRFAVLAPAIFVVQEHLERIVHDGAFPWGIANAPTFMLGLALQLPFALAAYGVARSLLRIAYVLGRLLTLERRRMRPSVAGCRPPAAQLAPRSTAPALDHAPRGPPLLAA